MNTPSKPSAERASSTDTRYHPGGTGARDARGILLRGAKHAPATPKTPAPLPPASAPKAEKEPSK